MRPLRLHAEAETAAARIRATLAGQAEPELADVMVVRRVGDLDARCMSPFVRAYIADALGQAA